MSISQNKFINVSDCTIIDLPKVSDSRGNLVFIQKNSPINIDIKRVYYLYDVPSGAERGGHAHYDLYQVLISISGSFTVHLNDGFESKSFLLNRPDLALLIGPGIWREITDFSSNSICLVLASELYCESDYIRDFNYFMQLRRDEKPQN